jgi:hypothetical protein
MKYKCKCGIELNLLWEDNTACKCGREYFWFHNPSGEYVRQVKLINGEEQPERVDWIKEEEDQFHTHTHLGCGYVGD